MKLLFAALPIVWLVFALGVLKLRAWKASLVGLLIALVVAPFGFGFQAEMMAKVALSGFCFALSPICLIILAALFTYLLCKRSGALLVIRSVLGNVSKDARVMTLFLAWGFGNFMEGIAGFGTSVAIPAAIMAGIGIPPLRAILACLIANSISTAYGSAGVVMMALAKVSELPPAKLAFCGVLEMSVGMLVVPLLIVAAVSGFRALKGVWWLCLVAGIFFMLPCLLISLFLGPELPGLIGSIASMAGIVLSARWVKKDDDFIIKASVQAERKFSSYHIFRAISPFLLVVALLSGYAFLGPAVKSWVSPGLVILAGAIIGGIFQRMWFKDQLLTLWAAFERNVPTYLTICFVLMMARVMDNSGMIKAIAEMLVRGTGRAYVLVSPLVGALGGFITGSGTSSNLIFGALQAQAASSLSLNETLVTAANLFGGGIGKMICPQSLAIGLAAVGLSGEEPKLLKSVLGYFVGILLLASFSTAFCYCLLTLNF